MTTVIPERPARAAEEIAVHFVEPSSDPTWNQRLSSLPGFTFFHTAEWCRILKHAYGFRPCYVVAEERGASSGLLPLIEVDNWPKGRRGISLPFTDKCSALSADSRVTQRLFEGAMHEGRCRGWKYLELRGTSQRPAETEPSLSFYEHHLALNRDEGRMFSRLNSGVQRSVRKAVKSNVAIDIATGFEAMRTFYRLHGKTRRKHGVPPQPFSFFESISRDIIEPGHGFIATARVNGQAIAAAVFFHFGTNAIYKFGASDERFQQLRGNNLVMWEAIRWLAGHGFTHLDFGRTSLSNEGLRRFKLGWGAVEGRLNYYKYDMGSGELMFEEDRASGWHTRVFNMLPLVVARCIGKFLYHRIA
jgi:hypothetical protein